MEQDITGISLFNRDIELLDNMLEEILFTHGGQELVSRVKRIRKLAKAWRTDDEHISADKEIKAEISSLDLSVRQDVIRAFSTFLLLVDVAEQNNKIRMNITYELENAKTDQPHSIENAIVKLKEAGYSDEDIKDAVSHLSMRLIVTAHPTEATKRTILDIKKRLSLRLRELDNPFLAEKEAAFVKENILNEVAILWQSNELSSQKPGVLDEVKGGLYYFDHTFFNVLPEVHRNMRISLSKHFPDENVGLGLLKSSGNLLAPGKILGNPCFHDSPHGVYFAPMEKNTPYRSVYKELEKRLCEGGMPAQVSDNIIEVIWDKLCTNATMNGVAALLQLSVEDVSGSEDGLFITNQIALEVCKVANAKGIGLNADTYLRKSREEGYERSEVKMHHYVSMVLDVYNKNKTEIDFINGAVVKEGKKLGIATPYNEAVWRLVRTLSENYENRYTPRA